MNKYVFTALPFILISLLLGTYGGLIKIGWIFPVNQAVAQHGAVMVGSFLGTLILLERVVVFKKVILYIFPAMSGASILFFLAGEFSIAMYLLIGSSISLIAIYLFLYYRYREIYIPIMMAGAVALFAGNLMLLNSRLYPVAVPFWIAFLLLTIVGERLELTKFLPGSRIKYMLLFISIAVYITGLFLDYHGIGQTIGGLALVMTSVWLTRYDIAFKSVKMKGIHRYIAINLIAGYAWLFISGVLMLAGFQTKFAYDSILHGFFLGFTFSMILAHGPIIIPGVAGFTFRPYHPVLFTWGILLQVSLVIRIFADLFTMPGLRTFAGMFNVIAVLGFFINIFVLIRIMKNKPYSA